jgi:hypothetical protein
VSDTLDAVQLMGERELAIRNLLNDDFVPFAQRTG